MGRRPGTKYSEDDPDRDEVARIREAELAAVPKNLSPCIRMEKAGTKVAFCACGESGKDPYCDGSHAAKNTGKTPIVVDIDKDKKMAWCMCKKSEIMPACNGSHAKYRMLKKELEDRIDTSVHDSIQGKNIRMTADMRENLKAWREEQKKIEERKQKEDK
jgi:CDGSH-type Zn-finger protein